MLELEKYRLVKILKIIKSYLGWTVIALLLGHSSMRMVLGANNTSKEGFGYLWYLFYNWGLVHIVLLIGFVIVFLFILFDVLYLKKKLESNRKSTMIRFGILLMIAVIVVFIHYLLEKVIDVI